MNNNDTLILIQWLSIGRWPNLRWDQQPTHRYFTLKEQQSFLRRLGIPDDYAVTPYSLTPRDSFHLLASRELPDANFSHEQRHLPYRVRLCGHDATVSSIVSRLYPMGIQTVRITARLELSSNTGYSQLMDELQPLRRSHAVRPIDHITRMAFALATGDRTVDIGSLTYKNHFGIQISLPIQADQIPGIIDKHKASITALLIGNLQPKALTAQIIDHIAKENQRINEKSNFEYLLENRQGLVYLVPKNGYTSPHPERFRRSLDISEMALLAKAILEFPSDERRLNENLVDFLVMKIESWITAPQVIFSSSMTSQLEWEVQSNASSLLPSLEQWQKAQGDSGTSRSKVDLFRHVPRDWHLIADLAKFLDSQKST